MDEEYEILAPIENELQGLSEALQPYGFTLEPTDLGYRCPVTVGGKQLGWSYFVSAQRMLRARESARHFKADFSVLQSNLFDEVYRSQPRPSLYLYIVGSPEELAQLDERRHSFEMEENLNYANKELATLEQLPALLGGLFSVIPLARRAHPEPQVRLLRELYDRAPTDEAPSVVLNRFTLTADKFEEALLPESRFADRALVAQVYRRIMGRDFHLEWTDSGVRYGRGGVPGGIPGFMSSSGEQACFSLACFLVEATRNVVPGLTLGLHSVVTSLDSLKRTRLFDVLRDLVSATGISLELQASNASVLSFARFKLKEVAQLTGFSG